MEEFRDMCKKMKKLADAGAWPKDVLGSTTDRQDTLLNGTGTSMFWNLGTCQTYANQANEEHPDWKVTLVNIMPEEYGYGATKYINAGLGINTFSENPERAAMLIDYLATSQEVADLTSLGIEGQDWEAVDDKTYKPLNGGWTSSNWWGWRNMNYMRDEQEENPTDVDKLVNEMSARFIILACGRNFSVVKLRESSCMQQLMCKLEIIISIIVDLEPGWIGRLRGQGLVEIFTTRMEST